jgi:hypothetical protein
VILAAEIVDWGALAQVVWVSAVAGIGFSLAFSLAIATAARASQHRRVGSAAVALGWGIAATLFAAACLAAVAVGVYVMLDK